MSYYRVKYTPTFTHVTYDDNGNETGSEVRPHLDRSGNPLVRHVVVFGLDKVNRVLANNAQRISVRRLLIKRDEVTDAEIAAGVEQAAQQAAQRRVEALERELAAQREALNARAQANNVDGQQSIFG